MYYFLNHMISSRIIAALFDLLFILIFFFAIIGILATVKWFRQRKHKNRKR